jgi:hypothetical protein
MTDLAARFAAFSRATRTRAPLYSRLSAGIAGNDLVERLFADAPSPARVPVNLFAAVHFLLLGESDAPLARFYPDLAAHPEGGDPVPAFLAFCAERAEPVGALLASRLPQTNEVGRSSLLLAGLAQLAAEPVTLLDVGASAGLNLLLDRYAYLDAQGHLLGQSTVTVPCSVRGVRPGAEGAHGLADRFPAISARLGLDATPVDLSDPVAVRWLEACVWPDQADRLARLRAAIDIAHAHPVQVRAGDAVADLAAVLAELDADSAVVATSWALCYLAFDRQREFMAELARLGASHDFSWVWAEAPERVRVLPVPTALAGDRATLLGLSTWRGGVRSDRLLARCHDHGGWLNWY